MNRISGVFALGWLFYGIAELAALMDGIGVWVILNPNVSFPLGFLPYDTMFAKPFFMLAAVPATGLLLWGVQYQPFRSWQKVALSFLVVWTVNLAIPDIMFPLGNIYYETLKFYFGLLSFGMAALTGLFYLYCLLVKK